MRINLREKLAPPVHATLRKAGVGVAKVAQRLLQVGKVEVEVKVDGRTIVAVFRRRRIQVEIVLRADHQEDSRVVIDSNDMKPLPLAETGPDPGA